MPNNAQMLQMIKGLDFPDYTFQEYPKAVPGPDKDAKGNPITVLVNSREEEIAVTGKEPTRHVNKPYVTIEDMTDEEVAAVLEARNKAKVLAEPMALQKPKTQAEALAEPIKK